MYALSSGRKAVLLLACASLASACSGGPAASLPSSPSAAEPAVVAHADDANGLLALYPFNGTLQDASGNGYTAKDSGKAKYAKGAPFGGKAIAFDGSGSAIVTAPLDISVKTIPALTMGGWFKAASIGTPPYGIVSNDDGDYDRSIDIDNRDAGGGINWSAFVGGAVVGTVPVQTGKWVFEAVAFNQTKLPGTYSLYVNDGTKTSVLKGKANFDGDSQTSAVTIGRNPSFDQPFAGDAANVFFYVGILTQKQIAAIVAGGPSKIPK